MGMLSSVLPQVCMSLGHKSLASLSDELSCILRHGGHYCCRDDDFGGDAVVPLKMGKRDSFLLADDISLLLGSQSSLDGGGHFVTVPSRWTHWFKFCVYIYMQQPQVQCTDCRTDPERFQALLVRCLPCRVAVPSMLNCDAALTKIKAT